MAKTFPKPRYIGDGIYAQIVERIGWPQLVLSTGTHELDKADNIIVLENDECNELVRYIKDVGASQA